MILSNLLEMLPKALANYYSANDNAFWIRRLNTILKEVERLGVRPERLDRFPIPNPSIAKFKVPTNCRYMRDLQQSNVPVKFEMRGEYAVIVDDNWTPWNGAQFTAGVNSTLIPPQAPQKFNALIPWANEEMLVGSAVRIEGFSPSQVPIDWTAIVTKATYIATSPTEEFSLYDIYVDDPEFPDLAPSFSMEFYTDFLIAMGDRRINVVTTTQPIPLDDEWEALLIAGLRYYGEIQLDETSNNTKVWMYEYEKAKKDFLKAGSQARGQVGAMKRYINPRYGSLR